jgi:hypothetical protein
MLVYVLKILSRWHPRFLFLVPETFYYCPYQLSTVLAGKLEKDFHRVSHCNKGAILLLVAVP